MIEWLGEYREIYAHLLPGSSLQWIGGLSSLPQLPAFEFERHSIEHFISSSYMLHIPRMYSDHSILCPQSQMKQTLAISSPQTYLGSKVKILLAGFPFPVGDESQ